MSKKKEWLYEITYEENDDGGQLGSLPMINVPKHEEMPKILFIWEVRNTDEFEPGINGEDVPIVDMQLRQYAMMETLKQKLSDVDYDKVRDALGLKPLAVAAEQGKKITDNVRQSVAKKEASALSKKM